MIDPMIDSITDPITDSLTNTDPMTVIFNMDQNLKYIQQKNYCQIQERSLKIEFYRKFFHVIATTPFWPFLIEL